MRKGINYCFKQQENESNAVKLYIYDDVTEYGEFDWNTWEYKESETSAKYFREQLNAIPVDGTLELHINSNGGSVKEGIAIYNQLKQHQCHKVGFVDGVAYSIAFVILQACDERVMGVGTSALIHDMWVTVSGNAKELRKMADDLDVLMQSNRQVFLSRSKLTEEQLIDMMGAETFLTPEQCLEYGLIDRIADYKAKLPSAKDSKEQVEQLKLLMVQKKVFAEQLEIFRKGTEPKRELEQHKNKIMKLFTEVK